MCCHINKQGIVEPQLYVSVNCEFLLYGLYRVSNQAKVQCEMPN